MTPNNPKPGPAALIRQRRRAGEEAGRQGVAIGARVADLRADAGLSQRELAELCGTTQSAIARLERGGRPPRIDTLARIAEALGVALRIELEER